MISHSYTPALKELNMNSCGMLPQYFLLLLLMQESAYAQSKPEPNEVSHIFAPHRPTTPTQHILITHTVCINSANSSLLRMCRAVTVKERSVQEALTNFEKHFLLLIQQGFFDFLFNSTVKLAVYA